MGFEGGTLSINVSLEAPRKVDNIMVSLLRSHSAWIFLPQKISIVTETRTIHKDILTPEQFIDPELKFVSIPIDDIPIKTFTIVIEGKEKIPAWHDGKGQPGWFFIDEIIIE